MVKKGMINFDCSKIAACDMYNISVYNPTATMYMKWQLTL